MSQPPLLLYDDARARQFAPFHLTRPAGELRAGALLVRERWAFALGTDAVGFVSATHLDGFREGRAPTFCSERPKGPVWLVHARALPALERVPEGTQVVRVAGETAAVRRVIDEALWDALVSGDAMLDDARLSGSYEATGVWIHEVWDLLTHLTAQLADDIPRLAAAQGIPAVRPAAVGGAGIGMHPVLVEPDAVIEPMVFFDTQEGPILVRQGARVRAFTRLVGPCAIGVGSEVTTDRISGSSIGDHCRVHGELVASILIGHANKTHDGFIGHSILGRWVNLGAGTITSNLKNTYGSVTLWTPTGYRETGRQFLGTLFGDHAKTGIGLRLTTGTVLGAGANVVEAMPPKSVAPFAWGAHPPYPRYRLPKFLEAAERAMGRRNEGLDAAQRAWWERVYAVATAER